MDVQIRANGIARCDTDESDEGSLLDLPAVSTTDDILLSRLAVSMGGRVWYAHYGGISEPQAPSVGPTKNVSILTLSLRKGQVSHILFMRCKVRLSVFSLSPPHLTGLHCCCLLNASYYQTTSK